MVFERANGMERQCLWARRRISCFCLWVLGCLWLVGRGDTAWAQANTVRFAVIGDFGVNSQSEQDVADLVASWNPEFVLALGDNNYPVGAASTIDVNIGKYYHAFISPYLGTYGAGATENRFFPCLGNHDWAGIEKDKPYRDYFALPGNEIGRAHV